MKQSTEERIASIVLIVGSLAYLTGAFFIPMPTLKQQLGPDGFPKAIGLGLLILSSIYAFQQFHGSAKAREKEAEIEKRAAIIGAESKIEGKADLKTMGFMLIVMLLYAVLFEYLGYALATFLAFMSGVLYLDRRHITRDAIIAVIASFVLQYIFSSWLRVQLPVGPLSFLGQ
jgi:putative tricarboxylic transport membrane protein